MYIDEAFYKEITGRNDFTDINCTKASDFIDYFILPNKVIDKDNKNLKKATAWQMVYMIDNEAITDSKFKLGNFSFEPTKKASRKQVSSDARRNLVLAGLLYRGL